MGAALRPRRTPDRLAERILPERDCLNLLSATGDTIQGARNTALLSVLYYTGCRVSEACGLQWRDLRLEDPPTVTIHGKGRCTRHVGLPPVCREALKRIMPKDGDPNDSVFTTRTGRGLSWPDSAGVPSLAAVRARHPCDGLGFKGPSGAGYARARQPGHYQPLCACATGRVVGSCPGGSPAVTKTRRASGNLISSDLRTCDIPELRGA